MLSSSLCKMELGDSNLIHVADRGSTGEGHWMELPPGFRFHPTDEELITHYLSKKVLDAGFNSIAVGEVDLNKCEPWELPQRAKVGEKEWYFFCVKDRKYPTGLRTNRATDAGYWKATGKDKEIYRGKVLVGMKKTLVFYRGRAPKGEKSNWVMHEYRLEGKCSILNLPRTARSEWVLSRVFKKLLNVNGKKALGAEKVVGPSYEVEVEEGLQPPILPPLMDIPPHVTCFSNAMDGQKAHEPDGLLSSAHHHFPSPFQPASTNNPSMAMSSPFFSKFALLSTSLYNGSFVNLLEGDGLKPKGERLSFSQETGLTTDMNPEISSDNEIGRSSFECLWNC